MFLDNPVIGVGQDNFPVRFADYEGDERLYGRTRMWRAAHSVYFTLLPELGLVGALIFFRMLYWIRRDVATIRRSSTIVPYGNAIEASLIGFLVSGIFISTLYYPNFWVTMGFAVALRRVVILDASPRSAATVASPTLPRPLWLEKV